MRSWVILFAATPLAVAQPFTFGIKGGLPLTDFLSATSSGNFGYFTTTNRYIVGPVAELHLPLGFGVEFNALYRHFQFSSASNAVDVLINSSTKSGAWQFPLLAKYRFPSKVVRPYVNAGVAWDTLSGLGQTITQTVIPTHITSTTHTSNPAELHQSTVSGFVAGVGLEIHLIVLHLSP